MSAQTNEPFSDADSQSGSTATDSPTEFIPRIVVAGPTKPMVERAPEPGSDDPARLPPMVGPPPVTGYSAHTGLPLPVAPRVRRRRPAGGWRLGLYRATAGLVNFGDSRRNRTRRELVLRAAAPIHGDYRVAVLSLKGGVGKTTTTLALGATLASTRGDRVIAVDANPDFGTLAQRGPDAQVSTVRDVLADKSIARYSDIRAHTSLTESRLEILASERDPAASQAFSALDYRCLIGTLHRFYNIILTDCGTGLVHSAMRGVLREASAVVLVTSPAMDSVRSTAATLDWLAYHGYPHLAAGAAVVVSAAAPGASIRDIGQVLRYFGQRVRSVHFVPFDEHLAEGAEVVLSRMNRATQDAFLALSAVITDGARQ